jgi:predicted transposase/invertase (TIGR01784 family)
MQVWKEEGIEEGIEKGKFEVAKNLLSSGIAPDIIMKSTGLSMERIQALSN